MNAYILSKSRATTHQTRQTSHSRASTAAILILLMVATGMRLYKLNSGLWFDEILTYLNYANLPFSTIVTTFDSENQHFLYSLMAHSSFLIFGASAWALRLPAVIFGVGSILALYLLGKEVAGPRQGLLAAGLLTFSYHHVWFSQNARGYTGLLFWTLLSSWFFLRGLKSEGVRNWLYYALAIALGLYTHMTMGFVVLGQFFVYVLNSVLRKHSSKTTFNALIFGFGAGGILTLLLYAVVIPQILNTVGGSEASVVSEWKNPLWTVFEIVRGLEVNFSAGIFVLGALVLFGAGLVSYWRTYPEIVFLLVVPPIVGAAVVVAMGHHLWPRFFFFAFGFGVLVVIRGAIILGALAASLLKIPPEKSAWIGTALCLVMIAVSALSVPFAYAPKQDYASALTFIQDERKPGDQIVTVSLSSVIYRDFYKTDWTPVETLQELDAVRSEAGRTWLVYTFPQVLASVYPDIMDTIHQDFNLVEEFRGTVGDGNIYVTISDLSVSQKTRQPTLPVSVANQP
jgi:mannosyltransferase